MEPARGEPLVELVAVMRRLRAECAWKREQTHRSLARHLVEELHETLEAIEVGDPDHLVEELGDLLLQVYFHAAIAEESGAFSIDDVAQGLWAKLVRRNPHVLAPDGGPADPATAPADAAAVNDLWEAAKATEKQRTDLTEGLPPALPALLYADKVLDRLARRGAPAGEGPDGEEPDQGGPSGAAAGVRPTLLLVPSPFLGPASWAPTTWWLRGRGAAVEVVDLGAVRDPQDVVDAVVAAAGDRPVVLVPHSNAGLFAPRLTELLDVRAVVYVDAATAGPDAESPLAPPALVEHLGHRVDEQGLLPPWTQWWSESDVDALVPDSATRAAVETEQRRLPATYLRAAVAVPEGWEGAPAAYLGFGATYAPEQARAAQAGWPVEVLDGGHLHPLVDPAAVGAAIERLAARLLPSSAAGVGDRLLAVVAAAREDGVDPEQALRDAVRRLLTARGAG